VYISPLALFAIIFCIQRRTMKRAVIAGGGYGGLRAIEKLVETPGLELVLVDANSYHFMQTEVYGYIAGTKDIDEIAVDLELWCGGFERPVRFIKDRIAALDAQKRVLILENGRLEYDYLIIATGARTRFPDSIKGLRERSFGIKQLGRSFGFHHKFEEVVKKRLEGERGRVNIAVIGAGLSGVEVAAEMGYMLKRYEKMLGSRADDIEITLVDACETILPGMDPYIIRTAAERLKKLGVSQRVSSSISSVKESEIVFENGDRMEYTFIIYTGGIVANSDFAPKEFRRNGIGQLLVTPYLNIEGYEQIYAVGDVAQIGDSAGRPLPPTAQIAEKSAEYAAESIKKRLSGVSAEPFRGRLDGIFIALGGRYAAAEIFGFRFSGVAAYYMKRLVTLVYFLGIDLRANAGYRIRSERKGV